MTDEIKSPDRLPKNANSDSLQASSRKPTKFVIYGEEMIEKQVNPCGKSGRVYLPSDWVGHVVKITRID